MIEKSQISAQAFKDTYSTKWYISTGELKSWEEIRLVYLELFELFNNKGIKVIYEKTFGNIEDTSTINNIRDIAIAETNLYNYPVSYLEGSPLGNNKISNITFYGLSDIEETVVEYKYLKSKKEPIAALISNPEDRRLYIHGLATNQFINDVYGETKEVFEIMDDLALSNGFASQDLIRTWIYLDQIYENYEIFNVSRKDFFQFKKIPFGSESNELPASTCIEGRKANDCTIAIDAFYVDKKYSTAKIERIFNPLQNEAEGDEYKFQPTFSRGMYIGNNEINEIQISGTASINNRGETTHINSPYNQIKETLINVNSLLKEKGLDFEDIVQMTCFFKEKSYYDEFVKVIEELNISWFGDSFVEGKVCRENLLFELDGIAIKKR